MICRSTLFYISIYTTAAAIDVLRCNDVLTPCGMVSFQMVSLHPFCVSVCTRAAYVVC